MPDAAATLKSAYDAIVASSGHPRTASNGDVVDDAWNREHFPYASALAAATGLDFVQLACVEFQTGLHGVSKVLAALDPSSPAGREGLRLQAVHRLASNLHAADAATTLEALRDPSLSPAAQRERWLDAFVEAFSLRAAGDPSVGYPPSAWPRCARIAELTGLSYEKLAAIEYKGGRKGLRVTVERIPDLPSRAEALAIAG